MARKNNCGAKQTDIYASLDFCPGETTLPGMRKNVYFTRRAYITKWPKVNKATGVFDGDFELAAEKYWKRIQVVVNSSKFTAASQGTYPNKTFRQHLEMMHPVLDGVYAAFQTSANNDDLIYLVQESSGHFKALGCEQYPTDTSFSDDSGQNATDAVGSTITAECDAPHTLLIYTGKIMLSADEDAQEDIDDEQTT